MSNLSPVLVAEDEEADVLFLRYAFNAAEIQNPLVAVGDGREVLKYLLREAPYDNADLYPAPVLLLLDLKMPLMTGFEVLDWLRQHQEFKTFPVVVLTSSDHELDRTKALELGASEYRVKPSGLRNLTTVVQELSAHWLKRATGAAGP